MLRIPMLPALLLSVTTSAWFTPPAGAQSIGESERILPAITADGGTFGNRLSLEGQWLAIGADFDANELGQGRVEIHRRVAGQWVFHQSIVAPDGFAGDHFGLPVVIRDDRMLVGMPWDDDRGNRAGAVHVYQLISNQWTWTQKLLPGVADNTGALFGSSCAFGRDTDEIIAGAFLESLETDTEGGAWVFRDQGDGYVLRQRLSLPGDHPSSYFGRSIDVENGILAIGLPGFIGEVGFRHGGVAIHSLEGDDWSLDGVLVPATPVPYQVFGESIDLEADRLAVGSPFEDTFGPDSGAVHMYRMIGGQPLLETVFGPEAEVRSFGFPVRLDADARRLASGAYAASLEGSFEGGAAWIHERRDGTWSTVTRLRPADPGSGDFFGIDIVFNGDEVFVGVPRHDGVATDGGGVARFELQDCDDSGYIDAWELAHGSDANGDGVMDVCQGIPGDLNADGVVDGIDLGMFASLWGTDGSLGGDINGDGVVDGGDIALILSDWTA